MRSACLLSLALLGCGGPAPPETVVPGPLARAWNGVPLDGEALPGGPAAVWPEPVFYAGGRYLVPYRAGGAVAARLVGAADVADVALGEGTLLGACAHGDGVAVALRSGDRVSLRFLDGSGAPVAETAFELDGEPQPGLVSDGQRVLVVTTERAPSVSGPPVALGAGWLVAPAGAVRVPLGRIDPAPPAWGDARGFVVGGRLLVASDGVRTFVERAPGAQLEGGRVFYRVDPPTGPAVTFDGGDWLGLPRAPVRASRDADGALVTLAPVSGQDDLLLHVGADLTPVGAPLPVPAGPDGGGVVPAVRGPVALWQAPVSSSGSADQLLARLDRESLAPLGPVRRVVRPASRAVVAVLGDADALAVWVDASGHVRYARW